jgi:hypothetical protein
MMIHPSNRSLAIHEAGHALADYLFGTPISIVSILPDDSSGGRVRMPEEDLARIMGILSGTDEETDPDDYDRIVTGHLVSLYAGSAAESRYTGRSVRECISGTSDEECVMEIVSRWCNDPEEMVQLSRDINSRSIALMVDAANWKAIEALADVLELEHEITGERAVSIFANVLAVS